MPAKPMQLIELKVISRVTIFLQAREFHGFLLARFGQKINFFMKLFPGIFFLLKRLAY